MSFYGKLSVEGRKVVFEKGAAGQAGLRPAARRPRRRAAGDPPDGGAGEQRATKNFEREFVTSTGEGDLFQQSVRALGLRPAEVMGKYVRLDLVEDPRLGQYNDRTTGMPRTRTGPVLRELFPDEETCREAADARYGGNKAGGTPTAQTSRRLGRSGAYRGAGAAGEWGEGCAGHDARGGRPLPARAAEDGGQRPGEVPGGAEDQQPAGPALRRDVARGGRAGGRGRR